MYLTSAMRLPTGKDFLIKLNKSLSYISIDEEKIYIFYDDYAQIDDK